MARLVQNPSSACGPRRGLDELSAARGIAIGTVFGFVLWALVGFTLWLALGPG